MALLPYFQNLSSTGFTYTILIYIYIYICCAFVGLDNKQLHYFIRQTYSVISCRLDCSISVSQLSSSPHTLPGMINYTLHLSANVTDPADLLFTENLAVVNG